MSPQPTEKKTQELPADALGTGQPPDPPGVEGDPVQSGAHQDGKQTQPLDSPVAEGDPAQSTDGSRSDLKRIQGGKFLRRLEALERQHRTTSPEEMYLFLDPARVAEAAEAHYSRGARWLEGLRNALVLVPLMLTWFSLGVASLAYSTAIQDRPTAVSDPFLQQWATGFPDARRVMFGTFDATPFIHHFTFIEVAFVDFACLLWIFWLTWRIHAREQKAYKRAAQLGSWVEEQVYALATKSLLRNVTPDESKQPYWAIRVNEAIEHLANTLGDVRGVVQTSEKAIEGTVDKFEGALYQQSSRVQEFLRGTVDVERSAGELKLLFQESQETYRALEKMLPEIHSYVRSLATQPEQTAQQMQLAARWLSYAGVEMARAAAAMQGKPVPDGGTMSNQHQEPWWGRVNPFRKRR